MFLFIVKVASDLRVPKSNDQFLVFTIVGPAVLFDTDDIPHFLDILHWASSESQCLGFVVVSFCSLSHLLVPLSLICCILILLTPNFGVGPLSVYLNLLFRWSCDLEYRLYVDDLNLYFQPLLFP